MILASIIVSYGMTVGVLLESVHNNTVLQPVKYIYSEEQLKDI